eukprot:scaffold47884_cov69-Phaeocystis_antarctica.AAC.3
MLSLECATLFSYCCTSETNVLLILYKYIKYIHAWLSCLKLLAATAQGSRPRCASAHDQINTELGPCAAQSRRQFNAAWSAMCDSTSLKLSPGSSWAMRSRRIRIAGITGGETVTYAESLVRSYSASCNDVRTLRSSRTVESVNLQGPARNGDEQQQQSEQHRLGAGRLSACGCLVPSSGCGGLDAANLELFERGHLFGIFASGVKLAANRDGQARRAVPSVGSAPRLRVKRSGALCWRT